MTKHVHQHSSLPPNTMAPLSHHLPQSHTDENAHNVLKRELFKEIDIFYGGTFRNGKYDKWLNMCISTPLCLQTPWSYLHTTVNTCRNNIVKKKLKMFWKGIFQGNIHLIPTVYQTKLWLNMCIGTLCLPAPWRRSLPPLATTTVTKKPKLFKSFSGLHPLQWGYMHESPVPLL